MSAPVALAVGVALLAGNAFFVGAEFAIISARRSAIEPAAARGNRRAQVVLWAMERASLMLACAQLGVTVCSTGLGMVAEPAIASLLVGPLGALGAGQGLAHVVAFAIALLVVVFLHVVLGELVPKNLAVTRPQGAALWFGPPLVWIARALRPVIVALNWAASAALRLAGVEPKDEVASAFTAQEVQSIVEQSRAEGVLTDEQGLLAGAIEFSEKSAGDVMVPARRLVCLRLGCTPEDVEKLVAKTGFSRFPVQDAAGEVQGYLHVKDVLYASQANRRRPVPVWRLRRLATAAPGDDIEDALRAMQRSGAHLARVDGAQGTAQEMLGVVFLEDILEELVGEVRDAMQRRLP